MWKKILAFWPAAARKIADWLRSSADRANKDGDGRVDDAAK